MAQTSINIKSKARNTNKDLTKAITFVNSEADNADLAAFGTALNALTTNNYVATNRVDKSNCDTEQGGGGSPAALLDPQLTLVVNEDNGNLNILFNGSGRVFIAGASAVEPFNEEVTSHTIEGGVYCDTADFREENNTSHAAIYLESDGTYAAAFDTFGFPT